MRRKVILYNTHLSGLIGEGEKQIRKIKDTLRVFAKRREVVLLWRPHPLSDETISSMAPRLMKEYEDIVRWYREQKIGIYDDSPDVNRALALADAYYGDGNSSLIPLFLITGKPVMIQNRTIVESERLRKFDAAKILGVFGEMVEFEGTVYLAPFYCGGIFAADLTTGRLQHLGVCEGDPILDYGPYGSLAVSDGTIVLAPAYQNDIVEYNINKACPDKTGFPHELQMRGHYANKYYEIFAEDSLIYILPDWAKKGIIYNRKTRKISYDNDLYELMQQYDCKGNGSAFRRGSVRAGSSTFFAYAQSNVIFKRDHQEKQWKAYQVGSQEMAYRSIAYDGEKFWLLADNGSDIYLWNGKGNGIQKINYGIDGFDGGGLPFIRIVYSKGYILLLPAYANMLIKIDVQTQETSCVRDLNTVDNKFGIFTKVGKYGGACVRENGNVLAYSVWENCLQEIDVSRETVDNIYLHLEPEALEQFKQLSDREIEDLALLPGERRHRTYDKIDWMHMENEYMNLEILLDIVEAGEDLVDKEQQKQCLEKFSAVTGKSGQMIFDKVVKK